MQISMSDMLLLSNRLSKYSVSLGIYLDLEFESPATSFRILNKRNVLIAPNIHQQTQMHLVLVTDSSLSW